VVLRSAMVSHHATPVTAPGIMAGILEVFGQLERLSVEIDAKLQEQ